MTSNNQQLPRRNLLASAAGATAAAMVGVVPASRSADAAEEDSWRVTNGRLQHSVALWCFRPMELDVLAREAAAIGMRSVELVGPSVFPVLKQHGLICAMTGSHNRDRGLNHLEHHAECLEKLTASIDATSAAGWPNVIAFSGKRAGLSDEEGIANTTAGLKKIAGHAERSKVTVCLEVLNSRVDVEMKGHPDYQCDKLEWAAEVCRRVGSPRVKILFDIYHIQIMQGDIITRIRQFKDDIAHYHVAGVPGRNDLDDRQELNYPAIVRAIVETGYRGFLGQEFIPSGPDKIGALRQAVRLCDV